METQIGYQEINHLLKSTSKEANELRSIYDGVVLSFQRWGYNEEDAQKMAGYYMGSMMTVHGVVGAGITLPRIQKVFGNTKQLIGKTATNAGKGTAVNKPLDKTELELQHGKGNVEQGGGNYKETKDKILDNQAANQKANESSKFGEHVAKEQEINAGKGTSQVKPIVIAELEVNGKKFTDTNQTARASDKANVNEPTLIADKIRDKEISTGKELPNGNMANAHAEIGVIQQAHNAGLAKGADLKITVTGKEICSYCRSDIVSSAKAADVKSVTIYEEKTGLTYYWRRGMKKLEVQN